MSGKPHVVAGAKKVCDCDDPESHTRDPYPDRPVHSDDPRVQAQLEAGALAARYAMRIGVRIEVRAQELDAQAAALREALKGATSSADQVQLNDAANVTENMAAELRALLEDA